jgi:hypothetical protein
LHKLLNKLWYFGCGARNYQDVQLKVHSGEETADPAQIVLETQRSTSARSHLCMLLRVAA